MPQQVTGEDGMIFHSNTDNFTSLVLNLMGLMAVPGYVGSFSPDLEHYSDFPPVV